MFYIIFSIFTVYIINKLFYPFIECQQPGGKMTGIPPINPLKTIQCTPIFSINLGISDNENGIWDFSKLFNIQYVGSNLIISAFFLLMYVNYCMYFKRTIKKNIKNKKINFAKSNRGTKVVQKIIVKMPIKLKLEDMI